MRSTIMALAAAAPLTLIGLGTEAMPAQVEAVPTSASPQITLIAAGCGRGFAPGPGGICHPIGRAVVVAPAVVVRRPAVVVRRPGCGVRVGPIGVRTPC